MVYDQASFSMLIFAVTGVLLWHRTTKKRLAGWICLAVSFSFAGSMILFLLYAR